MIILPYPSLCWRKWWRHSVGWRKERPEYIILPWCSESLIGASNKMATGSITYITCRLCSHLRPWSNFGDSKLRSSRWLDLNPSVRDNDHTRHSVQPVGVVTARHQSLLVTDISHYSSRMRGRFILINTIIVGHKNIYRKIPLIKLLTKLYKLYKPRAYKWDLILRRSVHLHCIHDPPHAQIELFLEMCFPRTSVSTVVRIWPKSTLKKMASKVKSRILRPFPRWFRSYADRSGDRRSRETNLKIAQPGHRLSLRLSMADGRSGWWAPDFTVYKEYLDQVSTSYLVRLVINHKCPAYS